MTVKKLEAEYDHLKEAVNTIVNGEDEDIFLANVGGETVALHKDCRHIQKFRS